MKRWIFRCSISVFVLSPQPLLCKYTNSADSLSVPELFQNTESPDWRTRFVALEQLGERGLQSPEIIQALTEALKDEDWRVRKIAAKELKKMGATATGFMRSPDCTFSAIEDNTNFSTSLRLMEQSTRTNEANIEDVYDKSQKRGTVGQQVIFKGHRGPVYEGVMALTVSRDGKHHAYTALKEQKLFPVIVNIR